MMDRRPGVNRPLRFFKRTSENVPHEPPPGLSAVPLTVRVLSGALVAMPTLPVTVNLPGICVVSALVPSTIVWLALTVALAPIAVDCVKLATVGPALSPRAVLFVPVLFERPDSSPIKVLLWPVVLLLPALVP